MQLRHPMFFRPTDNSVEQRINHLGIVHKIHEPKTRPLLVPRRITSTIDDSSDTPCNLSVLIGQKENGVADFEGRILLLVQRHHFFLYQTRHIIGIIFI